METDFLIVGSGIAGLSFALKVAVLGKVVIFTKKEKIDTATNLAQGGIAGVLSKDDTYQSHINDTLRSGAGLCDEEIVKMVVRQGTARIKNLIDVGVDFVKNERGELDLGKEGGHSHRRVAHSYDLTGREIERALLTAVKENPNIELHENHTAVDLLIHKEESGGDRCVGAYVLDPEGRVVSYKAKVTTLCTGGCGKVYLYTSNPDISTGDGVAMAFRAGAKITNMEFVQFHPTCLYHPQAKNFLISEAVRGEGALLVDYAGERFMEKYDERAELATRDTVARAIDKEMKARGLDCVYLDISHKSDEFLAKRFPTIYDRCRDFGLNISRDKIPVVPAAHYMCGGVLVDENGESSLKNLFVLGEAANTGLHGANRLASNSLLEATVFAEKAYTYCKDHVTDLLSFEFPSIDPWFSGEAVDLEEEILINHNWDIIRRTMWNYVGIVRNTKRLTLASRRMSEIVTEIEQHYLDYLISPNMIELRNISLISSMIIEAAIERRESRGLHYTTDHPETKTNWLHWNVFQRDMNSKEWKAKLIDQIPMND